MATAGPALAKHLGVDPNKATLVTYVAPDTPAQAAGLADWDVIVKINGSDNASPNDIRRVIRASQPGDTVDFSVWDRGSLKNITITLEPADHDRMVPVRTPTSS
ncbi:MAG: PDZ domain-containing protein [Phycisphaerales bacterium]|nr:PDZ domain-containing protein [Phycisphaerales bacterium]